MVGEVAKTQFVSALAQLTDTPVPYVRQRVRSLFDAGIGPRRNEPLTFSAMADYIIGFLSSPSHLEAAEITRKFTAFKLVRVNEGRRAEAVLDLMQLDPNSLLNVVLAAVIKARSEQSTLHVENLVASWPPHDEFVIQLPHGGGLLSTTLTYADRLPVQRKLRPTTSWPLRHRLSMEGHVIDALAHLGASNEEQVD